MATRRRWPYIVLGVAILCVFVAIGVVLVGVAWFRENVHVEAASTTSAEEEFAAVRQKFGSREPLLEIHDGVPRFTKARDSIRTDPDTRLNTMHVLAWDPDDEQLARVSIPFWFLRLKSDPIRLGAYARGLDDDGVTLRPEDIEKYGPGIVLDTRGDDDERVLVWVQ
jgi:hypothetical protein